MQEPASPTPAQQREAWGGGEQGAYEEATAAATTDRGRAEQGGFGSGHEGGRGVGAEELRQRMQVQASPPQQRGGAPGATCRQRAHRETAYSKVKPLSTSSRSYTAQVFRSGVVQGGSTFDPAARPAMPAASHSTNAAAEPATASPPMPGRLHLRHSCSGVGGGGAAAPALPVPTIPSKLVSHEDWDALQNAAQRQQRRAEEAVQQLQEERQRAAESSRAASRQVADLKHQLEELQMELDAYKVESQLQLQQERRQCQQLGQQLEQAVGSVVAAKIGQADAEERERKAREEVERLQRLRMGAVLRFS